MNQTPSPYDHGTRLEPKPWVKDGITGNDEPRPASADDYGRVDFDNDAGVTEFTVWAVPTEDGIMIRVNSVSETPITLETEPERLIRMAHVTKLHDRLEALGMEAHDYLTWNDEGDPATFTPGHYELASFDPEGDQFYVELTYTGTNPYEDQGTVPTGVTWHTRFREYDSHGSSRVLSSPHYSVPIGEADTVVTAARQWATEAEEKHTRYFHGPSKQQYPQRPDAGPTLS